MVRTIAEENIVCQRLRKKHFENPGYRKWSDMIPLHCTDYGSKVEDIFFISYITGRLLSETDGETFYKLLDNGHELPINWVSLYDYFDSRFADEENYAIGEITRLVIEGNTNECVRWSVMDILNFYRDKLLSPSYDIV